MSPGLSALPGVGRTDHVTVLTKLPVPVTFAENWSVLPTIAVAGLGTTVTEVIVDPAGAV